MTNKERMEYHTSAILEANFGILSGTRADRIGEYKVSVIRKALNEAYKMGALEGIIR